MSEGGSGFLAGLCLAVLCFGIGWWISGHETKREQVRASMFESCLKAGKDPLVCKEATR